MTILAVNMYSREALAIDVGVHLRSENVVATLNRLVAERGKPKYLFADIAVQHSRNRVATALN